MREEKVLHAHAVSLPVRKTVALVVFALAGLLLFALCSPQADAKAKRQTKVAKGPKGLDFYKPPKSSPSGTEP